MFQKFTDPVYSVNALCHVRKASAYAAYATPISHKQLTQPYAHQCFAYVEHSYDKHIVNMNREVFRVAHIAVCVSVHEHLIHVRAPPILPHKPKELSSQ